MSTAFLTAQNEVRLTLKNASPADLRAVSRATGASQNPEFDMDDRSNRAADVEILFTRDAMDLTGWRRLGEQDAVWREGRLAVCESGNSSPVEIELPLADGDDAPIRICYPSGLKRLPLLRSVINTVCTENQILGVHGTAFTCGDCGYLVCGWPRGGKTGTLLAYLLQNSQYLAAEWVYVSHNGQMMHGVPEDIRLRDWHIKQSGGRLRHVGYRHRVRLATRRHAAATFSGISRLLKSVAPTASRSIRKLSAAIDRRRYIDRPATDWLGIPLRPRAAPLNVILLVGTHDSPDINVRPLDSCEAARQLAVLQDEDVGDLIQVCRRWNYAVSDVSEWLSKYYTRRDGLNNQLVDGKAIFAVDHPHNVSLEDLYLKLQSTVGSLCSLSH